MNQVETVRIRCIDGVVHVYAGRLGDTFFNSFHRAWWLAICDILSQHVEASAL